MSEMHERPPRESILQRYLLFWLVLIGLLAFYWTDWLPRTWRGWLPGTGDPLIDTAPYRRYIFAATMLAIGSLLPRDEIREVAKRWRSVLGGTAIQYISMPLLAYGIGRLCGLDGGWLIGILVVGCVPGAMASNVLTLAARGNVSYSVSLTTSATVLSPLVVPCVLWIALRRWAEVSVLEEGWKLTWMVVLPVITGHLLSRYWSVWEKVSRRTAAIIANLTILWIIAIVIAANRHTLPDTSARLLLALLGLNVAGYLVGTLGSLLLRLPGSMRRALTLEIGMQNAGLGAVLAMDLFGKDSVEAIPPAIYTFGCMLTGTILARVWAEFGSNDS